jgi:NuA3 HAT complex component NTO1
MADLTAFDVLYRLDGKGVFLRRLQFVRRRLEERFYTSVSTFSADLAHVFTTEIGVQPAEDTAELQLQISGRAPELSLEQREKRKLAKRIIKAIQPALEEAMRNESELNGKPFEKELQELDLILESGLLSRRESLADRPQIVEHDGDYKEHTEANLDVTATKAERDDDRDVVMDGGEELEERQEDDEREMKVDDPIVGLTEPDGVSNGTVLGNVDNGKASNASTLRAPMVNGIEITERDEENVSLLLSDQFISRERERLTPPLDVQGDSLLPLTQGGIQWYMQPFDPVGTTIHEERWTGRDVMRSFSEELSELDEDELQVLVDTELDVSFPAVDDGKGVGATNVDAADSIDPLKQNVRRTRRRWRGFR